MQGVLFTLPFHFADIIAAALTFALIISVGRNNISCVILINNLIYAYFRSYF